MRCVLEAPGFQTAVRPPFQLELNQNARIDIQMVVGQVTETMNVQAARSAVANGKYTAWNGNNQPHQRESSARDAELRATYAAGARSGESRIRKP